MIQRILPIKLTRKPPETEHNSFYSLDEENFREFEANWQNHFPILSQPHRAEEYNIIKIKKLK
jgi:hypothetical protein